MKVGGKRKHSSVPSSSKTAKKSAVSVSSLAVVAPNDGNEVHGVDEGAVVVAEPLVVVPPFQNGVVEEDEEEFEVKNVGAVVADPDALPLADKEQVSPLANDYFEVETILRKKFVKGKAFYLIKWLGWPKKYNTWEPLENLHTVMDIVEDFEERWEIAKQRPSRRKSTGSLSGVKRTLERSVTPYSLRCLQPTTDNNRALPVRPMADLNYEDIPAFPQPVIFADEVENVTEESNSQRGNRTKRTRLANGSGPNVEANEDPEHDPMLLELRALTNNGHDAADRLGIHPQENNLALGDGNVDGKPNGVVQQPGQSDLRRGAKKRKSGTVKRFKKDLYPGESSKPQNPNGLFDAAAELGIRGPADNVGRVARAEPPPIIVILKPIHYHLREPSREEDTIVTFMARRADGEDVWVDSKYLKENYRDMLIDFYEKHLRDYPTH